MSIEAIDILTSLIKKFEGCRLKAYPDPGSGGAPWTCGWGSTHGVTKDTVWTQDKADNELESDANIALIQACKASPSLDASSRQAAIADFIYNCGLANYKRSTLKRYIDAKQWEHAKMEILKWNKASGHVLNGLTKRRKAEANLL